MLAIFTKLFLSINLLNVCSDLLQYICFFNLTTPVEVMAKVYVILDHPSYNDPSVFGPKQFLMLFILMLNKVVDKMLPCGTLSFCTYRYICSKDIEQNAILNINQGP